MKLAAVHQRRAEHDAEEHGVHNRGISSTQIVEVLILVAVLLAVVILYDLTNLSVSERIRELSTIKVLGFPHQRDHDVHLPRNDPAVTAGHTRRIRLRRMAAPIHHHRSATRRSHVRPRHQLDRIGGPGHRRGRGTNRARLDRIPPARKRWTCSKH